MSHVDAQGRSYEPAGTLAMRAWRRAHKEDARVLDMLLRRAGRDKHGSIVGTAEDYQSAIACAHAAAGVCHACAYDIARCERDDDGCIVCPECGLAWRFPDRIRRHRGKDVQRMEDRSLFGAAIFNPLVLLWRLVPPFRKEPSDRS
jgi:hypothetical protein